MTATEKTRARKRADEHVLLKPPMTFACMHCGERYDMATPVAIELVSAAMGAFAKMHRGCRLAPEKGRACDHCLKFGHAAEACPLTQYGDDPKRWWNGPDTGMSSKTLFNVMMGREPGFPTGGRPSVPHDPSDFGRCHRLLAKFPAWRARIGEMAAVPGWERLAPAWDELEALYEEESPSGKAPKLFARMRELERRS